ncbi:MAG: TonB-dependent receptor plug domain-containing protein [Bacteroidota bacterium]
MRYRLLIVLITACFSSVFAQVKVKGKCVDKKGNPLELTTVKADQNGMPYFTRTDFDGNFSIEIPAGKTRFLFQYDNNKVEMEFVIPAQDSFLLEIIRFNFENLDSVTINRDRDIVNGIPSLPPYDYQRNPLSTLEKFLILVTPATSTNELSNNYNVRGGNYDENLVYVNGFLINRPFLTRSGQQEGMSFINTALVKEVRFSAGGFQAVYGDKLSSVLDIEYKKPDTLHASIMASLLGVEGHVEQGIGSRFRYLVGGRYRSNGYLLNSLPTKGNYNPVFWDGQFVTEFDLTEKWQWTVLGHISSNNYQFSPVSQQTDFGTANEAYSFNIYFDGQEDTRFLTMTGGTAFKYTGKKLQANTYLTAFRSNEREYFDIQGQYYINELETDPSKEEYGDSIAVLGVGTFMNHARNRLTASILSAYHDATYSFNEKSAFRYGFGIQHDDFSDVLSEWRMIDSAGYSVPQNTAGVDLFEVIKGNLKLKNDRVHAYVQQNQQWSGKKKDRFVTKTVKIKNASTGLKVLKTFSDTMKGGTAKWELDAGVRALYTSFNNDFMVTPRVSISFIPVKYVFHKDHFERRSMKLRFAAGAYYQPPFYREFRTFTGGLNPNVVAQKSLHFVLGGDYNFYMWGREKPFKVSAETYYKYLWDINPYEIENVRTRYYADNIAKGYAVGFDANMHGEFVKGLESFFKIGVLSTKEDVENDSYWNFYNAAGERITSISEDQDAVDSVEVFPGYIRRPSDQRLNMGILFQDHMPGLERFTVQMGLNFGSRLPYGPPDFTRYKDTLSMKSYFRVDIGLAFDLLKKDRSKIKDKWYGKFSDALVSFEVFNLLGINNVLSKQWIQDVSGGYYAIPNYLTQRRFNLKIIVRI